TGTETAQITAKAAYRPRMRESYNQGAADGEGVSGAWQCSLPPAVAGEAGDGGGRAVAARHCAPVSRPVLAARLALHSLSPRPAVRPPGRWGHTPSSIGSNHDVIRSLP